jgi:hypothetical protein
MNLALVTIIATYSSIGISSASGRQLALNVEILVPNFWICKNSVVGISSALLASR